jgi:hypothetical protein
MASIGQGWVQYEDPSTGKPYYFNSVRNVSSWENPIASKKESSSSLPTPRAQRSWSLSTKAVFEEYVKSNPAEASQQEVISLLTQASEASSEVKKQIKGLVKEGRIPEAGKKLFRLSVGIGRMGTVLQDREISPTLAEDSRGRTGGDLRQFDFYKKHSRVTKKVGSSGSRLIAEKPKERGGKVTFDDLKTGKRMPLGELRELTTEAFTDLNERGKYRLRAVSMSTKGDSTVAVSQPQFKRGEMLWLTKSKKVNTWKESTLQLNSKTMLVLKMAKERDDNGQINVQKERRRIELKDVLVCACAARWEGKTGGGSGGKRGKASSMLVGSASRMSSLWGGTSSAMAKQHAAGPGGGACGHAVRPARAASAFTPPRVRSGTTAKAKLQIIAEDGADLAEDACRDVDDDAEAEGCEFRIIFRDQDRAPERFKVGSAEEKHEWIKCISNNIQLAFESLRK